MKYSIDERRRWLVAEYKPDMGDGCGGTSYRDPTDEEWAQLKARFELHALLASEGELDTARSPDVDAAREALFAGSAGADCRRLIAAFEAAIRAEAETFHHVRSCGICAEQRAAIRADATSWAEALDDCQRQLDAIRAEGLDVERLARAMKDSDSEPWGDVSSYRPWAGRILARLAEAER